jgi:hypothetical protein
MAGGAGRIAAVLLHAFAEIALQLLTYGLGRGLDYYDGPAIDKITDSTMKAGNRFSSLVLGVVMSDPFRLRRGTSQVESGSESPKKK